MLKAVFRSLALAFAAFVFLFLGGITDVRAQSFTQMGAPSNAYYWGVKTGLPNCGMSQDGNAIIGWTEDVTGNETDWSWYAPANAYAYWAYETILTSVSDDSSTVSGYNVANHPYYGFIATPSGGACTPLYAYDQFGTQIDCSASLATNAGLIAYGFDGNPQNFTFQYYAGTFTDIGTTQTNSTVYPIAASADGSTVYGAILSLTGGGTQAYQYVSAIGLFEQLGAWTPSECSTDGSVVAGVASQQGDLAIFYLANSSKTINGPSNTLGVGISPDGLTGFGTYSNSSDGTNHGFLFDVATQTLTDLGASSYILTCSSGVSGKFCGMGFDSNGQNHNGYYQLGYGWVDMAAVLQSYGMAANWYIDGVYGISADGTKLFGSGYNYADSAWENWYAVVPNVATANGDAYATSYATPLNVSAPGVLGNDGNPFGSTAQLVSRPSNGSVTLNADGSFSYTPNDGYSGVDTFTYEAVAGVSGQASNIATVTISVGDQLGLLTLNPPNITAGQVSTGTISLNAPALTDSVINLSSSNANVEVPASVTIPAGTTSAGFTVTTAVSNSAYSSQISASWSGGIEYATLTVAANSLSIGMTPTTVPGGQPSTGTISLGAVIASDLAVSLSSSTDGVAVPASIVIPAGSLTADFQATTAPSGSDYSAQITATSLAGSQITTLYVTGGGLASLSVTPTTVAGGTGAVGTVTLFQAAGSDTIVALASSAQGVTVPASVTVPAGTSSANFAITTTVCTSDFSAQISATWQSTIYANLNVLGNHLSGVTVTPSGLPGGQSAKCTVRLASPVSADTQVALSSSANGVTLPATVTIRAGSNRVTCVVATSATQATYVARISANWFGSTASATLTVTGLPVRTPVAFHVTDLGVLGGPNSYAFGVNATQAVVGNSELSGGQSYHAFLDAGTGMQDLGTLGGSSSNALGINASGQVVGWSLNDGDAYRRAFLWTQSGGLTDIGTLGGDGAVAASINISGQIVGSSLIAGDASSHAFAWTQSGGMADLGTLGGDTSSASGVNATGEIVGDAFTSGDAADHAFLYANGVMNDLGTLGGTNSLALGINDSGATVGDANLTGDSAYHAFLYANGALNDLGTLGGSNSEALSINASGEIVGFSYLGDNATLHGFLYVKGVMHDLNQMLDPSSRGVTVSAACAINDRWYIVGYGATPDSNGNYHALLLTPIFMAQPGTLP